MKPTLSLTHTTPPVSLDTSLWLALVIEVDPWSVNDKSKPKFFSSLINFIFREGKDDKYVLVGMERIGPSCCNEGKVINRGLPTNIVHFTSAMSEWISLKLFHYKNLWISIKILPLCLFSIHFRSILVS